MSTINADSFVSWVNAKPMYRHCKIEIEENISTGKVETKIWVYDRDLDASQYVQSVNEINLEAIKEQRDRETYEKLRRQFDK